MSGTWSPPSKTKMAMKGCPISLQGLQTGHYKQPLLKISWLNWAAALKKDADREKRKKIMPKNRLSVAATVMPPLMLVLMKWKFHLPTHLETGQPIENLT